MHGWPEAVEYNNDLADTFTAEIAYFLDVVQKGVAPVASFAEAARVLQVTLAAYTAASEQAVVSLPEDPTQPGVAVATA